jgi:hypothetical protein
MQEPMHAYLITSGSAIDRVHAIEKRLHDLRVEATDVVYLTDENEHIGIDAVRAFGRQLILTPYQSPVIAGIILQAERLTVEAQNALLKVLEEPPPHVIFFVETPSSDLLLPTIVSRLTHLTHETPIRVLAPDDECQKTIRKLLAASPGNKLAIIDDIATDRVKAKEWVQTALITCRALLLLEIQHSGDPAAIETMHRLIKGLLKSQGELELNINPKLVLDTVFLSL